MPYRKLSKKEKKVRQKPWITRGILKSIKIKDAFNAKFIRTNDKYYYRRYKTIQGQNQPSHKNK